jgi:hypothetical protein
MIDPEKAIKFGYKEVTPYQELLHSVGLLHTARKLDVKYALSLVKKIINQRFDSYSISIIYDTVRDKKDAVIAKTYKEGRDGFSSRIKKSLPKSSVEFNSNVGATIVELSANNNGLQKLSNSIAFTSLSCHFRLILIFDITRNNFQMFMKSSKNKQQKLK